MIKTQRTTAAVIRSIPIVCLMLTSTILSAQREKPMKSAGGEMTLMKKYFLCILSRGEGASSSDILDGHRALMATYHANGTIILSGPLEDPGALGAYLYNAETPERAHELIKADPAVSSGRFTYKLYPWWVQKNTTIQ